MASNVVCQTTGAFRENISVMASVIVPTGATKIPNSVPTVRHQTLLTHRCSVMSIRPQLLNSMVHFSADSSKMGPTKIKTQYPNFIFYALPTLYISLELLVPQKWFTYQYLQDLTREIIKIKSKGRTQKIK